MTRAHAGQNDLRITRILHDVMGDMAKEMRGAHVPRCSAGVGFQNENALPCSNKQTIHTSLLGTWLWLNEPTDAQHTGRRGPEITAPSASNRRAA